MFQSELPKLSLYHRNFCWFCARVINVVKGLDLEIEGRNIWKDQQAMQDLEQATGRSTVPVLRIESADGTVKWMPESNDIIQYLRGLK